MTTTFRDGTRDETDTYVTIPEEQTTVPPDPFDVTFVNFSNDTYEYIRRYTTLNAPADIKNGIIDKLYVNGTTESTNTSTGALIVNGGVGIGSSVNISGIISITNTTESTTKDTGALIVEGGVGVGENLNVGNNLYVAGVSTFVGNVNFLGGTNGTITIGDATGDNVVFNADINSSIIPNTNNTYDVGSSSQKWKDGYFAGIVTSKDGHFSGVLTASDYKILSSSSSEDSGLTFQRVFRKNSVSAGQLYKIAEYEDTEGDVAIEIQVSSETPSHSGTSTYRFQGGFRQLIGSYYRIYPFNDGGGHGDGPDTGLDSNAWNLFIYGTTVSGSDYKYGVAIHVPAGRSTKNFVITITELKRGMTFTDQSSSAVITSFTNSGNIYSHNNLIVGNRIGVGKVPTTAIDVNGTVTATSFSGSFTGGVSAGIATISDQLILTGTNDTTTGGGQLYLNGLTGNRIDFNTNGVAAPAFTTRSAGTKLVLYPAIGGSSSDYALGIESGTLWYSVPNTTSVHRWYGGTTSMMNLTNSNLTVNGNISGANITPTSTTLPTFGMYKPIDNSTSLQSCLGFTINSVEYARLTEYGYWLVNTAYNDGYNLSGTGAGRWGRIVAYETDANVSPLKAVNVNGSAGGAQVLIEASRANSTAYIFLQCVSSATGASDTEFYVRGDGQVFTDGTYNSFGADYAEYFEWVDGNTSNEDRRGISVILQGDKIRPAETGEDPIGVISANATVIGDAAENRWKEKYLRDDFGSYIRESHNVIEWTDENGKLHSYESYSIPDDIEIPENHTVKTLDENGNPFTHRKLNPDFNPDLEYIPRSERPEWDTVGLMGKLAVRKGQPVGSRWIKLRDISASVEQWLVR